VSVSPVSLVYSPCPNDTFIFHAWTHGLLPGAPEVRVAHHDIDTLNALALAGEPDVAKVSFHAFGHLRERYALLHSGGALGRGCGPLVVVRGTDGIRDAGGNGGTAPGRSLAGLRVAIPGRLTTAALLLRLYAPELDDPVMMTYDRIMPAVAAGEVDAGLIIHESRFTYPQFGLSCLVDLGKWWERATGHPIPLGGIVVRRDLGGERAAAIDAAVAASLAYARSHPGAAAAYIAEHAQEMDPAVCQEHIDLYVNEYSADYGAEGEAAIGHLLSTAERVGAVPASRAGLFWDAG
jgi:1,4-dihydroxy-6-naphthoate synthase